MRVPPRYFSQESVSQHGDDLLPEHGGQLGETFSLTEKKTFTFQFSNNTVNSGHLRQTLLWQWTAATMASAVARPARTQTLASKVCSPLAWDPHLCYHVSCWSFQPCCSDFDLQPEMAKRQVLHSLPIQTCRSGALRF